MAAATARGRTCTVGHLPNSRSRHSEAPATLALIFQSSERLVRRQPVPFRSLRQHACSVTGGVVSSHAFRGAGSLRAAADGSRMTENVQLPEATPVWKEGGSAAQFPATPGVYVVYDRDGTLQYVGMSRKVAVSVDNHMAELPDSVHAVAVVPVTDATRAALTSAWQQTLQAAVTATGAVPPGNVKGEKAWAARRAVKKPEVRLTPGKGLQDLSVPLEDIIQQVVDQNRVVAFVKGTRTAPECGFSHQVLTLLNASRADYEVVNVLDDVHNPGLRETLKTFSQWPTIPQLYVEGEFVGGADVLVEMAGKGELNPLLQAGP